MTSDEDDGSDIEMEEVFPAVKPGEILDLDEVPDAPHQQRENEETVKLNSNFLPTDYLTKANFGRLEPEEWLNDSLIDLFMR
jgi:Ulp1 family protease